MKVKSTQWILLITLSLIWGSSFILIKKGLENGLSAYQVGAFRIIFSAFFLLIIGFKSLAQIKPFQWKYIAITAFFGTFLPAFLFALAETKVSSSVCSILNSLTPLNTLLIGTLAFGLTIKRNQFLGVFVGLAGTAILILNGKQQSSDNYYYCILVLIASVCYGLNVNLVKRFLSNLKPLSITTGNFLILLFPALLVLFFTDFKSQLQIISFQHGLLYIAILGIVGTGIANIIFFKLIQIASPVFATSVTYLIPIVAFFWGLVDNESLTAIQFLGALVVLIGVYLSNKK